MEMEMGRERLGEPMGKERTGSANALCVFGYVCGLKMSVRKNWDKNRIKHFELKEWMIWPKEGDSLHTY
jgi:hypothetical protein